MTDQATRRFTGGHTPPERTMDMSNKRKSAAGGRTVEPLVLRWLHSEHYHCKKCGAQMTLMTRTPWQVANGVCAIGLCKQCNMVLVERERGRPRWSCGLRWALRDWLL